MTARPKVLVVDLAPGVWGAQAYLLRLAEPMRRRGYDLVLAAPDGLELSAAWRSHNLPFVAAELPASRTVRDADGRLRATLVCREAGALRHTVEEISRLARRVGAAAIWGNGHAVHLDVALAGRRLAVPAVLHLHEEVGPLFGRALRSAAIALAPAAVAVSQAVADRVPRPLRRRVETIPNGVDVAEFTPGEPDRDLRTALGAGPDDVLIAAVARIDPDKRIEDVVAALAPLRTRRGWRLVVVGSTSDHSAYETSVIETATRTLGSAVTFVGRREDVPQILRAADLLIHTGIREGMPLGVIEAQASGLPVVAYRVAGVPEAVVERETALLADPLNTAELTRHVRRLLDHPDMRAAMSRRAVERARRVHSIERQADRHVELLRGLSATPRLPVQPEWQWSA